ncbi:MAG: decaprenyl-phosphate phosphoribosyltransferase [Chloroflexi bacterium]|nr:decaprenyl-phosphate phosphoribosyltransferase [Chloroflexota bacterium]
MLKALLKTMRPKQWLKNGFVFVALVFDEKLLQPGPLARTVLAFVIFCLASSTVYLLNDLVDREKDRQHPTKRHRPLASGALSPQVAVVAAIIFAMISLLAAFWLSLGFGLVIVSYLALNVAYSFWLKHIVIIDVLLVASFYLLRVVAGVLVVQAERFSPWLYILITLFALFIAIGKRHHELTLLGEENANAHRTSLEEYNRRLLDSMIVMVTSAATIAYSFYTFSAPNLPANHTMMLTIPFVLYFFFRYLYLIYVRSEGGAPEELLLRDKPLLACVALWGLAVVVVLYVF